MALKETLRLFEAYQESNKEGWENCYASLGCKFEFGIYLLLMLFTLQREVQHLGARYLIELDRALQSSRQAEAPPRAALHLVQVLADAFLLAFIGLRITQGSKTYLSSMSAAIGILRAIHNNSSPLLALAHVLAKNNVGGAYNDVHVVDYAK